MFSAEPWARAFINAIPQKAGGQTEIAALEASLEFLRLFCGESLAVPGSLSGTSGALRIERFVRAALAKAKLAENNSALYALKFFLLMVQKGCFYRCERITNRIEALINEKKGTVRLFLEVPFEPDSAFLESLKEAVIKKTGLSQALLSVRLAPELIGGFRLRAGSVLFDGSLKTALGRMEAELSNPRQEV